MSADRDTYCKLNLDNCSFPRILWNTADSRAYNGRSGNCQLKQGTIWYNPLYQPIEEATADTTAVHVAAMIIADTDSIPAAAAFSAKVVPVNGFVGSDLQWSTCLIWSGLRS